MKKSTAVGLFFWVIVTAFCVIMTVLTLPECIGVYTGNLPQVTDLIYESKDGNVPDGYAKIQVDASLGNFATKTETRNYVTTVTEYYIAWLPDESFMAVAVESKKDIAQLDKISEMTWDYLSGTTNSLSEDYVELTGEVRTLDSDARRLFEDALSQFGVTEDEYLIRHDVIKCTKNPGFDVIWVILFLVAADAACIIWLISLIKSIKKYRHDKLTGVEASVDDSTSRPIPASKAENERVVVSAGEAFGRIRSNELKQAIGLNRIYIVFFATLSAILAFVIGFIIYRTNFYVAPKDAVVYNLADPQAMESGKKYKMAELTIDSIPVLADYHSGNSYNDYIVTSGDRFFIASISEDDIDNVRAEIKNTGSSRLFGFLDTIPSSPQEECISALNSNYGTAYHDSQYKEVFGKYTIYVKPSYNGAGIGGDIVWLIYFFGGLFFLLFFVLFTGCIGERKYVKKRLMAMTDMQYTAFEDALGDFDALSPGSLEKLFKDHQ